MRASILFICIFLNTLISIGQAKKTITANQKTIPVIQTQNQKTSYSFGVLVASNLKAQAGDSLDLNALFQGINDAYKGKPIQMKIEECSNMAQQHVQQYSRRKGERVRKESSAFLEKNKLDPTVKSTASGLQYKILNTGAGASPLATDRVTVHYTGKLIDGTIFDSSVQRGQPATFSVGGVIKGWTEALQLMHEGDKWMLFIPQELGYGAGGNNGIPPLAALIFEVELIKVN